MKKLLLLIPALLLTGILFTSCQKEPTVVEPGNLNLVNIQNSGSGCTPIFAGQFTEVGTVCLVDDWSTNTLTVTYSMMAPGWEITEIHFAIGDQMSDIPVTKKGNMIPGQFPYVYSFANGVTTYSFTVPFNFFGVTGCDDNTIYYAAAHCAVQLVENGQVIQTETGWGNGSTHPGNNWGEIFNFKLECYGGGNDSGSETAFAYGCDKAMCFLDIPNENFMRWGWTNGPLTEFGTYYFDIYAGAGQCDLSKGTLVGELIVEYTGSTAEVAFTTCGGYTMDETHLYVGCDILPMNNGEYTIAPGQFPFIHEDLPANTNSDSYTIENLACQNGIYVVAHAVVMGDYTQGGCGTPGCDFEPPIPPCNEWIVYGSKLTTGDDILYKIDLNNKTFVEEYNPGNIRNVDNYPNGNAYDPINDRLYFGTDDGKLYYHELGSATHVLVTTGLGNIASGCWYNGEYYWVKNGTNQLWKLNGTTPILVGTVPTNNGYGDIVFDPANPGWLIGSAGSGTAVWYAYNVTSNESFPLDRTDLIGSPGHKQLAFGSDGVLYAVDSGNTGGAVQGRFYSVVVDYAAHQVALSIYWDSNLPLTDLASGPQCQ